MVKFHFRDLCNLSIVRLGASAARAELPSVLVPKDARAGKGKEVVEKKSSYTYEDLLSCAHGELFGPGNARLPLPPMLMLDRIVKISEEGGTYGRGEIEAEFDIKPDLWFFKCHFESDPIMPGALGLDAMWQLLGFFLGWLGLPGRGRAISVGEVKFSGEVLEMARKVSYHINIRRTIVRKLILGIADGIVKVDGQQAFEVKDLRAGLFQPSSSA